MPRPLHRRPLVTLAALLPLAALVAGGADAAWTPKPPSISAPGANAADPVAAVGPAGDTAFSWKRRDAAGDWRIQLRVRSGADGTLGATQTLSMAGDDASAPDVAVDAAGRAVAVWSQHDAATGGYTVLGRTRTADGTLSTFRYLSAGVGAGVASRDPQPQVELAPSGAAVVVWQAPFADTYRAVARTITADGTVSATWQTLSREDVADRPVAVALDDDGTATVAWTRDDGASTRVEARTRAADGGLGALRILTPAGQDATAPAVAVTPGGDAVVAWARENATYTSLHARALTAAGTVSASQRISQNTHDVDDNAITGWGEVGISDSGDAVFVWQEDRFCCGTEVAVRGMSADGALSGVDFARTTATARQPHVVVRPAGNAILSFTQLDETFWERIVVRSRSVAGLLGPAQVVSAFGRDAFDNDLAMNDAGLAAVTWLREDGTAEPTCCDRVQYVVGP